MKDIEHHAVLYCAAAVLCCCRLLLFRSLRRQTHVDERFTAETMCSLTHIDALNVATSLYAAV